jgi:hypothetical protein
MMRFAFREFKMFCFDVGFVLSVGELIPESYDAIRDGDKITATVGRGKKETRQVRVWFMGVDYHAAIIFFLCGFEHFVVLRVCVGRVRHCYD